MVNIVSITTVAPLTFEISLKNTSFHIAMNSLGFYLFRMVVEFSLKPVYYTMFGENFQVSGIHIPRKCIVSKHFCLCPSPLADSPRFEILFPLAGKRGGGSYNLLYQNSTRNHDLKWFGTLDYLSLYDMQFFQMWWLHSFVNNIYHIVWH